MPSLPDLSFILAFLCGSCGNCVEIPGIFRISGMRVCLLVRVYRNLKIEIELHRWWGGWICSNFLMWIILNLYADILNDTTIVYGLSKEPRFGYQIYDRNREEVRYTVGLYLWILHRFYVFSFCLFRRLGFICLYGLWYLVHDLLLTLVSISMAHQVFYQKFVNTIQDSINEQSLVWNYPNLH